MAGYIREGPRQLAVDLMHVHRAIATTARIGLSLILDAVTASQFIERHILQRRAVEEQILTTVLLLDKTKTPVCNSRDSSLCHYGVPSAIGGSAGKMPDQVLIPYGHLSAYHIPAHDTGKVEL